MTRRLLLVGYSLTSGGAERVLANLANYWAARGHQVTVATIADSSSDFYELDGRVSRVALSMSGESASIAAALRENWRRVRGLRRVLTRFRPDIAIAFTTRINVLLGLASIGGRWVTIGSEHVHPPRFQLGTPWNLLRRWLYGRLGAVAVLTEEMAAWVKANTSAARVRVIPNPVWPLQDLEPARDPEALVPQKCRVLLGVGRLTEQKGFDLAIRAFADLAGRHSEWVFVILGEGPQRPELERQVRQLNLESRVIMPGVAGNISAWYQRADIYVMSSRFEGFGNTLAEAICSGSAAISFDCETGPSTIIQHGVNGLLVPAEDVSALRDALNRLIVNEQDRRALAAAGFDARSRYSIRGVAGQWELLFEELLSASPSQRGGVSGPKSPERPAAREGKLHVDRLTAPSDRPEAEKRIWRKNRISH